MNDSKSLRVHRKIKKTKKFFLKDVHHIDGGHRADAGQHQQYPLQEAEGVGGLLSTAGKSFKIKLLKNCLYFIYPSSKVSSSGRRLVRAM